MRHWVLVIAGAIAIAGCSKGGDPRSVAKGDAAPAKVAKAAPIDLAAAAPQIAYTYSFRFKLAADRIPAVQAGHIGLCDRLGPRCHVVSMDQARDARGFADAGLEFVVPADAARRFGDALVATVDREGGETTGRTIQGDDLSKQIVDVEARLRGRQALASRLLDVVQTHKGSIAELVAAEKALADVQQEIDTARSELADARGHVVMSTVRIGYWASAGVGGFFTPISDSFAAMGAIAGMSLGALLSLLAAVLPWMLPLAAVMVAVRWWKRRRVDEDA